MEGLFIMKWRAFEFLHEHNSGGPIVNFFRSTVTLSEMSHDFNEDAMILLTDGYLRSCAQAGTKDRLF